MSAARKSFTQEKMVFGLDVGTVIALLILAVTAVLLYGMDLYFKLNQPPVVIEHRITVALDPEKEGEDEGGRPVENELEKEEEVPSVYGRYANRHRLESRD